MLSTLANTKSEMGPVDPDTGSRRPTEYSPWQREGFLDFSSLSGS
jgi:hypothetical protein